MDMGSIMEWRLIMVLCIIATIADVGRGSGRLVKISNNCTCPGDILMYQCNVTGSGFTIWRGSAFDCPERESRIRLRHSLFGASDGSMGLCNDGAIIGRSLGISIDSSNNQVYMSQLMINLTASSSVIGQTVECVHLDNIAETAIGSTTIEIADPPPPPTNIQLVGVGSEQLVFNWTTVDSNCSTLQYNITSNCGTCLDTIETATSSIICSIDIDLSMITLCFFGIQSVICTNVSGSLSTLLNVTLKVPQPPIISSVIPHYNMTGSKLTIIDVKFNEVEAFMISNGVDGSALSYNISYTDSNTGNICKSLIIPAPLCVQEICTAPPFNLLPCFERVRDGDITILISASNRLGRGSPSVTTIGRTNMYVNISFQSTTKIVCTFLDQQEGQGAISCDIVYGPCQQSNMIARGTISSPNTVEIDLSTIINPEYCYVVNASNGSMFTVLIDLELTLPSVTTKPDSESPSQSNLSLVALITIPIVIIIGAVVIAAVIIYMKQRNKRVQGSEERVRLLHDQSEPQPIWVHISYILNDEPKELMNVLQKLENLHINFKNIKIGRCTSAEMHNITTLVKKIYMECEKDLTEEEKKRIEDLQIGIAGTLNVSCTAETQEYTKEKIAKQQSFVIKENLKDQPGALLSLLKVIDSVEACQHINIMDIDIKQLQNEETEDYARVIITFLPDMAEDWEKKYSEKRYEYESIIELVETTQV